MKLHEKKDVVRAFAKEYNYDRAAISLLYDEIVEFMRDHLIAGDSITVRGLGVFETEVTPPTNRYDLQLGEVIPMPAMRHLRFTYAPSLRQRVKAMRVEESELDAIMKSAKKS